MVCSEWRNRTVGPHKTVAAIPCLNTEPSIANVVKGAARYVDHVIVIDDGSRDGTAEVARRAGASVIRHESNQGYGAAIKSCLEAAKANGSGVLVILDGDGQHDPDDIPRVVAPVLRGEADLVIGSRFITNEHNMPRYRRFGIRVITWLWTFGSKMKVTDTQSGFRAYNRRLLEALCPSENGMAVSIEILETTRRRGAVIKEVPVSCVYYSPPLNRRAISHGIGVALSVLRIRLKNRRLRGYDCWR